MYLKSLANEWLYVVARIVFGLMYLSHGIPKLSNMSGTMWFVGLGETGIGLLLVLGLFTRLGALLGIILALLTYFKAHTAWPPLASGGELILCYLFFFVVVLYLGGKKFMLDKVFFKKELF